MVNVMFFPPPIGQESLFLNFVDEDEKYSRSDCDSFANLKFQCIDDALGRFVGRTTQLLGEWEAGECKISLTGFL